MLTIVFDLGVVLAPLTTQVADAAAVLGVPPEELAPAYWAHRERWDRGGSDADYWRAVARDTGLGASGVDDELVERLTRQDLATWTTLRPGARRLLDELAATDVEVWLLSNAAASFEPLVATLEWGRRFHGLVVSGAVGMAKPDESIYRLVEQRTGRRGDELAFVDDRPENLVVPAARGWHTHLWVDDEDTRVWVAGLGLLG